MKRKKGNGISMRRVHTLGKEGIRLLFNDSVCNVVSLEIENWTKSMALLLRYRILRGRERERERERQRERQRERDRERQRETDFPLCLPHSLHSKH